MSVILDPASELEEVIQNVRTILATPRGTVPLDRAFGILGAALDDPLPAARAAMTSDIIEAIAKYEPRAEPISVSYEMDNLSGRLLPTVTIRLISGELINV